MLHSVAAGVVAGLCTLPPKRPQDDLVRCSANLTARKTVPEFMECDEQKDINPSEPKQMERTLTSGRHYAGLYTMETIRSARTNGSHDSK
jgi:hypothetical protein